jgi:hypothetical protein
MAHEWPTTSVDGPQRIAKVGWYKALRQLVLTEQGSINRLTGAELLTLQTLSE